MLALLAEWSCACTIRGYETFDREPTGVIVANRVAPDAVIVRIVRGSASEDPAVDCRDARLLELRTPGRADIGYLFEAVSGNLPSGLISTCAIAPLSNELGASTFTWLDYPNQPENGVRCHRLHR